MNNVLFTRINIFRNLKDYKFLPKLEKEKAQEIEDKVKQTIGTDFYKLNLSSAEVGVINYLKENALISKNSQIVFANKKNNVSVSLFEQEHILIRATSFGFSKNTIQLALNTANKLASKLSLAYNDDYGFLMSNLTNVGCGLMLECDLDLNAIVGINKIEQVKQNIRKLGFVLKEKEANIFTLFTTCNLGFSEKEIIDEFEKMVSKLQDLEVESAKMLDVSRHDEILDKIMRSQAIIGSAYLMSAEELKKHLSILRTGLNLGLNVIDCEVVNKIQQLVTNKNSEIVSQSELIKLAEQVRKIVKGE